MRVLVCGGRNYKNHALMGRVLDDLYYRMDHEQQNVFVLIHGGARGADTLADNWARENSGYYSVEKYGADWDKYGKRAGYLRNKAMLDEGKPDLVIAFPGDKGTIMMIKLAKEAGVKVKIVTDKSWRAENGYT